MPKEGYKITKLEVWMSDSDAPLPMQTVGNGYSFVMPCGVEVIVEVERIGGGGVEHSVTVLTAGGGSPVADKTMAAAGETVTITLNPWEGRVLDYMQLAYDDENGSEAYDICNVPYFTMPDSDVTVAVYYKMGSENPEPEVPSIKVTFDPTEGTCATASAAVNASNKLAKLPKAEREGYIFKGWFTVDDKLVTTDMVFTEDTTVYAQWYKVSHVTDPEQNDFKADIALKDSQIVDLLVDDDDLKKGKDVIVYMQVDELAESAVSSAAREAILARAGEDEIAAYMDIRLLKQIGDEPPIVIHNTKGAVPITLQLPDDLIPENARKNSFYIVYYHGNQAKSIPATFNASAQTVTFKASEFSVYTLVYSPQAAGNAHASLPKTGDDAQPLMWTALACISLLGMMIIRRRKEA